MHFIFKSLLISLFLIPASYADSGKVNFYACDKANCQNKFIQYKKLAKSGSPDAQMILASMYYTGYGVEKDAHKSLRWLKKASQHKVPEAYYRIGLLYLSDMSIERNVPKGVSLLKRAAKGGNIDAAYSLANLYMQGVLVSEDLTASKKWLNKGNELAGSSKPASSNAQIHISTDENIEHIAVSGPSLDSVLEYSIASIRKSHNINRGRLANRYCIFCTSTFQPKNDAESFHFSPFFEAAGLFK